jgi:rRNA processing protein Krr1/Pno1
MEHCDELSRQELLALKEIRLTGRTTDPKMALQLLNDDMIIDSQERCLQLTGKGRRMLVRGSPSLWDMAS